MNKVKHTVFNDGVAIIYRADNIAEDGERPEIKLIPLRKVMFAYRTVGMARYFEAMQNQIKISKMILIPRYADVDTNDIVIINGDNTQYRIEQVQHKNDTKPVTTQLTLSAIKAGEEYEIK